MSGTAPNEKPRSRFLVLAGSAAAAIIGLAGLTGWVLDRPLLTSVASGLIPMAPSTALLLVANGAALFLAAVFHQSHTARRAGLAVGSVTIVVALPLIPLSILGVRPSIEHLGIALRMVNNEFPLGDMSPVTALGFTSGGAVLLTALSVSARHRWQAALARGLAGFTTATGFVLLLPYVLGIPLFYGGSIIPPAATGALGLFALGAALFVFAGTRVGPSTQAIDGAVPASSVLILVFVVAAAGISTAGYWYASSDEQRYRAGIDEELSAVAELKVGEIVHWRGERLGDGRVFHENVNFSVLARRALASPADGDAQGRLRAWLTQVRAAYGYDRVYVLDARGNLRMSVPAAPESVDSFVGEQVPAILRAGQVMLQDFYRDARDQRIYLAVLVPIRDAEGPVGVLGLRVDPETYLYPLISRWPGASKSAETLLVRREGSDALFLSELRFRKGTALTLRSSLANERMAAVQAVLGRTGIMEGIDYRGVPVVADVRPVPDSPWFVVARMDVSEIYGPLRERQRVLILLIGALVVGAGTAVGLVYGRQRARFYRDRYRVAEALRASEERFRSIADNMLEGFQIIGRDWRYQYVNDAAAAHGRRAKDELLGRTLTECYPGIDETPMFAALRKCMEERTPQRMENEFAFPDGSKGWFELHAQPTSEGIFVLSLDRTRRKAAEQALVASEERFRRLAEDAPDIVYRLRLHPERRFEYVSPSVRPITGYSPEDLYENPDLLMDRLVHTDDRPLLDAAFRGEDPGGALTVRLVRKDGAVIWSEQRITPLFDESGVMVAAEGIARDVTKRKQAEQRSEHLNRVLRAIREVNQLIVREKGRERLVQGACDVLVETRGFDAAWIVLTDRLPASLDSGQANVPEPAFSRFTSLLRSGNLPRCARALQSQARGLVTQDTGAVCLDCPLAGLRDGACALTASLQHEEHCYGYLGVSVPGALADDEELSLLEEVAGDLGFALHGLEAEEARRESEQSLRTIFDSALDGILVADAQTRRFVRANAAICRMLGYGLEELEGLSVPDIHPAESLGHVTAAFEKQLKGETPLATDIPVRRKDGSVFYADVNSAPIELHGRGHVLAVFRDITKRREAEQKLRDANTQLQETQQHLALQARWVQALNSVARDIARGNSLESIFRVVMHYLEESFPFATGGISLGGEEGSDSTVLVLSSRGRTLARRLGVKEGTRLPATHSFLPAGQEVTGPVTVLLADVTPADLPEPAQELFRRTQRLGLQTVVVVPLATESVRTGALFMLYRQAVSLSEPELDFLRGMAEYVCLAVQNRSLYDALEGSYRELQLTQRSLLVQERMKALGQMASGIAHDINNTLAPITLYTEALAASELGQQEPARRYLGTIQSAAGDIEGITTRLRAFYKAEEQGELETLDVGELFDSVLELCRPRWKDIPNRRGVEIQVQRQVPSRLPPLVANRTEVREALLNLVFNAVDALPQGGSITLRARKKAEGLCLEVADTGAGMNEEEKRRCVEPFYTTKGAEGSGLGLSTVFGTMQRHKGEMHIESEPGQGTTVRLVFPLAHRPSRQPAADKRPPGTAVPPLRILCVDDDPRVREVLKEMLVRNGHQVQSCADGQEALLVFQSAKSAQSGFDLVITDLGMPHMDGKTLAGKIKELSPGTPVILLSGWGNFMNLNGDLPQSVDCLLGKPPTMARLLSAIQEITGAKRSDRKQGAPE